MASAASTTSGETAATTPSTTTSSSSSSGGDDVKASVAGLKAFLDKNGVRYDDCLEKADFVARVKQTIDNLKEAKAKEVPTHPIPSLARFFLRTLAHRRV
jgi:hypothetical protein